MILRHRWSVRQRVSVVPGHPQGGIRRQLSSVPLQLDQVLERVDVAQLAGVNQTHEQVAHLCPIQCSIEQRILTVQNRPFEASLHNVMPRPGLCRAAGSSDAPACLPMIADAA